MNIQTPSADRTWNEKLAAVPRKIKTRSLDQMKDVKQRVNAMATKANDRMRGNPAKWIGIAAGAGLGIGLLGGFLQRRASHRHMPAVVIIEAC